MQISFQDWTRDVLCRKHYTINSNFAFSGRDDRGRGEARRWGALSGVFQAYDGNTLLIEQSNSSEDAVSEYSRAFGLGAMDILVVANGGPIISLKISLLSLEHDISYSAAVAFRALGQEAATKLLQSVHEGSLSLRAIKTGSGCT